MRHFFALVHKEAESAYGFQLPDLPNVFSAADEQNRSMTNSD
ncbi:type II toxin-antitoxin system HicB family antitoxin [Mesorhizobium sp. L-8-10]|nr:type II toxin-antitoxin system HicB family antitoxin [Mesorhizobium sp. L-8-10]